MPNVGLELMTIGLRVARSVDWAIRASLLKAILGGSVSVMSSWQSAIAIGLYLGK